MQDPYVRIYFGGQQYKTSVCKEGGRNPSWTETFTFNNATDTNLRVEVWDDDIGNDDLIGAGTFNLMKIYNYPGMRSENGKSLVMQSTSISSTRVEEQAGYLFLSNCRA